MMELSTTQKVLLLVSVPATGMLLYLLLKRQDEDDVDSFATSRQTVIELTVPHNLVGSIIGSQGSNIKQLQEASGSRVNFKDRTEGEEDRVIVIRGTPEGAQKAELMIRKVIADQPVILTEVVHVPQTAVGRIIGRNGDNIRQLCRMSKAKIFVERDVGRRTDTTREVTISGSQNAITNAKGMLFEKVEEDESMRRKMALTSNNRPPRPHRPRTSEPSTDYTVTADKPGYVEEYVDGSGAANGSVHMGQLTEADPADDGRQWPDHRDYMEVFVSAVEHPQHFWVQILTARSAELDRLMTDMTAYYCDAATAQACRVDQVEEGMLVGATFPQDPDGLWYRAQVVEVSNHQLDLYYVDYGDSEWVPQKNVVKLRSDFLTLPFQAFECSLGQIRPTESEWTEEAISRFEILAHTAKWKSLQARTLSYRQDAQGPIPCLKLVDTNGPQDINIAEELVRRRLAVFTGDSPDGASEPAPGAPPCQTHEVCAETYQPVRGTARRTGQVNGANAFFFRQRSDPPSEFQCFGQSDLSNGNVLTLDTGQPPTDSKLSFDTSDLNIASSVLGDATFLISADGRKNCLESDDAPNTDCLSHLIAASNECVSDNVPCTGGKEGIDVKNNIDESAVNSYSLCRDIRCDLSQYRENVIDNIPITSKLFQLSPSEFAHASPQNNASHNQHTDSKSCVNEIVCISPVIDHINSKSFLPPSLPPSPSSPVSIQQKVMINVPVVDSENCLKSRTTASDILLVEPTQICLCEPAEISLCEPPLSPICPVVILEEIITETEVVTDTIQVISPRRPSTPKSSFICEEQHSPENMFTQQSSKVFKEPDMCEDGKEPNYVHSCSNSTGNNMSPNKYRDASDDDALRPVTTTNYGVICDKIDKLAEELFEITNFSSGYKVEPDNLVNTDDLISESDSHNTNFGIENNSSESTNCIIKQPHAAYFDVDVKENDDVIEQSCDIHDDSNKSHDVSEYLSVSDNNSASNYRFHPPIGSARTQEHHVFSFIPELLVHPRSESNTILSPIHFNYSWHKNNNLTDTAIVGQKRECAVDLNESVDSLESGLSSGISECRDDFFHMYVEQDVDHTNDIWKHSTGSGTFAHGGPPLADSPVTDLPGGISASGYSEGNQVQVNPEIAIFNAERNTTDIHIDADSLDGSTDGCSECDRLSVASFTRDSRHKRVSETLSEDSLIDSLDGDNITESHPLCIATNNSRTDTESLFNSPLFTAWRIEELRLVFDLDNSEDDLSLPTSDESLNANPPEPIALKPVLEDGNGIELSHVPGMHSFDELDMLCDDVDELQEFNKISDLEKHNDNHEQSANTEGLEHISTDCGHSSKSERQEAANEPPVLNKVVMPNEHHRPHYGMSVDSLGSVGSIDYTDFCSMVNQIHSITEPSHSSAAYDENRRQNSDIDEELSDDSLDLVFHDNIKDDFTDVLSVCPNSVPQENESPFSDDSIEELKQSEILSSDIMLTECERSDIPYEETQLQELTPDCFDRYCTMTPMRSYALYSIEKGDNIESGVTSNVLDTSFIRYGGDEFADNPQRLTEMIDIDIQITPPDINTESISPQEQVCDGSSSSMQNLSPKSALKRPGSKKKRLRVRFSAPEKEDSGLQGMKVDEDWADYTDDNESYFVYDHSSGQFRPEEYAYEEEVTAF